MPTREPQFGKQCKDNSSGRKLGSGSNFGGPESRPTPSPDAGDGSGEHQIRNEPCVTEGTFSSIPETGKET